MYFTAIEPCKLLNSHESSIGLFILFLRRKPHLANNFKSSWSNAAGTCNTLFLSANVKPLSSSSNSGCVSFSFGSCWSAVNDDRPSGKLSPNVQRTLRPPRPRPPFSTSGHWSDWTVGTRNTYVWSCSIATVDGSKEKVTKIQPQCSWLVPAECVLSVFQGSLANYSALIN